MSEARAHDSDLRVRVVETGLTTYPDITIVCGPSERDPEDENAVTNPALIVEVLSRSTEEYDRGDKFEHYKRIATLSQYVLISHLERTIEVWSRAENAEWSLVVSRDGDEAKLSSIRAILAVSEVYDSAAEPAG